MERLYDSGILDVEPNTITYSAVIEAWSTSPNKKLIVPKVYEILQKMTHKAEEGEEKSAPNTVTFNTVIKAVGRSNEPEKAPKVIKLLEQMKKMHESGKGNTNPNIRTYNAIISCCALTTGSIESKARAFNTALGVLKELRESKHIEPDTYTYPAILKSSQNLLENNEKGHENVRDIFKMCCEDGMLDALFFNNLKRFLGDKLLSSVLKLGPSIDSMLPRKFPHQWSRNVSNRNNNKRRRLPRRRNQTQ